MQTIIIKMISMFLSIFMFLGNLFPSLFPVVENTYEVYDIGMFNMESNDDTIIVNDYVQWEKYTENKTTNENYTWKDFFEKNIVLIPITLTCSGKEFEINSITEDGDSLFFDYTINHKTGEHTQNITTKIVVVEASKRINAVCESWTEIEEGINPKPDNPNNPDNPTIIPSLENYNGYNYFITDKKLYPSNTIDSYEQLTSYGVTNSTPGFEKYNDKYFETGSLVVAPIYFVDDGKTLRLSSIEEDDVEIKDTNGNVIETKRYLFANGWVEDGNTNYPEGMYRIVIEVSKEVDDFSFLRLGFGGEGTVFDYNMFGNLSLVDNQTMIVSSYNKWKQIVSSELNEWYLKDFGVCEEFFEEKNLALSLVMIPNDNYVVDILDVNHDGASVTIDYDVIDKYNNSSTLVEYKVIGTEIPKETTNIILNCNSNRMQYASFSASSFNLKNKEPILVSDYETWTSILNSTSSKFSEYNENYFKDNAIVLIPESFQNTAIEAELISVATENPTIEIVYGLNYKHDIGMTVIIDKVILIEIPDNKATNVVAKNKSLKNYCFASDDVDLMKKTPIIISDYSTWSSMVDVTEQKYSRYNEDYFKYGSLVAFVITLPDTGAEPIFKYAYEDGDTINVGYTTYSMGGFTMISYKAAVIEVSKDVTKVNTETF